MALNLDGIYLTIFQETQNLLNKWFRSKDTSFYYHGIYELAETWQKCVDSEERYFQ